MIERWTRGHLRNLRPPLGRGPKGAWRGVGAAASASLLFSLMITNNVLVLS